MRGEEWREGGRRVGGGEEGGGKEGGKEGKKGGRSGGRVGREEEREGEGGRGDLSSRVVAPSIHILVLCSTIHISFYISVYESTLLCLEYRNDFIALHFYLQIFAS
jgi:hypothetical protein